MKKIYALLAMLVMSISFAPAQNWLRDMRDPRVNFYTVQSEFNEWWAANRISIMQHEHTVGKGEKEGAWKLYRRWEHQLAPLMAATHGVRLGAPNASEQALYQQRLAAQHSNQRSGGTPAWTYIGAPISFDDGNGDSSCGRVNRVVFDPVNPNILYCCAPTGGLWKSVNFGQSWQLLNTDALPQIGLSDMCINPQNTNSIYIATGDAPNSQCYSIGVLKSIDGGQTWAATGLSWTVTQGILISRLLMNPLDSNILYAATNIGVYKTTDGGVTWNNMDSLYSLNGMEFNPLNPNTIYACNTQVFKSMDAGMTWTALTNGLPTAASSNGFQIGVTAADTTCVYVLVSDTSLEGGFSPYNNFGGLYRSLNSGASFTLQNAYPDPSNTGTQGYYDLTIGVSSTNRDLLVIGAVNSSFSSDGGLSWNNGNQNTASHVDHHDVHFFPGSVDTLFSCDDGGLFISTDGGNDWSGLNNGMHIGELYNVSSSSQTQYMYLSGRQDEGTLYQDSSFEEIAFGGDGLECLIDPFNQNNMYMSSEDGYIGYSNGGINNLNLLVTSYNNSGVNGPGTWNTPFALGPNNSNTIYIGKDFVYESNDGGNTFNQLSFPDLTSSYYYTLLAIAPSDTNYIYAGGYFNLFRSADGGQTYTEITGTLVGGYITSLAISPTNPLEIYLGWAGTAANSTVLYRSTDGGASFQPFDAGMPLGNAFYALSIAPVRNSNGAIYASLANAGGVYYIDNTMSSWIPYSTGLPNVSVDQIEIDYCSGKVRAATYGRDIWETGPYQALLVPPLAHAVISTSASLCPSVTETFTDSSSFTPTSWQWYFPGGIPSSSTQQNPSVSYRSNGSSYHVTFIATNANGPDTAYYTVQTSICAGIGPLTAGTSISIYPNPSNGQFVLSVSGMYRGAVDVAVTDGEGQNVYTGSYTKDTDAMTTDCSLPHLASGVYFMHITTGGGSSMQKLVISE